jgi:hypothetical protein
VRGKLPLCEQQFAILFDGNASEMGKLETVNGTLRRRIRIADLIRNTATRPTVLFFFGNGRN